MAFLYKENRDEVIVELQEKLKRERQLKHVFLLISALMIIIPVLFYVIFR